MWSPTFKSVSNSTTSRRRLVHALPSGEAGQVSFTEEIAKIQPRGILTIPKKLRRSIGLADNTFVKISGNKYRLVIEPVKVVPYPVRNYNDSEIEEFINLDARESKYLRQKRISSNSAKEN